MALTHALADTSIFIANETGRALDQALVPDNIAVSIITIGELRAGVLAAADARTRAQRLRTLTAALAFEPIVVDDAVAEQWALLRVLLRDNSLRMPVNDSWIAASAMSLGIPVLTQDTDFPELAELQVLRV